MNSRFSGDIAIIGMAGLFARASSAEMLWANILNKVDAIDDPLPSWRSDLFYDPQSEELERIYTCKGGFLKDLSRFDPRPFGIMPAALKGSEPDHFHALALSAAAMKDAGLKAGEFDCVSTGIIIGHGVHAHRANVSGIHHGIITDQTLRLLKQLVPGIDADVLER